MYQKLTIIGRVEREPEFGYTAAGRAVCWFSVLTEHIQKQITSFHVTTTGGLAEVCNMELIKDRAVLCEGYLNLETNGEPYLWQDQDSQGRKQYSLTAFRVIPFEVQATYDVEVLETLDEENILSQHLHTLGYHPSDR